MTVAEKAIKVGQEELLKADQALGTLPLSLSVALGHDRALIVEEFLALHIRPRPQWLPYFLWKRLLPRILYLTDANAIKEDSE